MLFPTFANVASASPIVVAQAQQGTITGTVRSAGGALLGNADISIDGPGGQKKTKSDANGAFGFTEPTGSYTITVSHGGFQSGETDVVVGGAQNVMVVVTLNETDLSNLRVIGRSNATSTRNAAQFNVSSSPTQTITQETISQRDPLALTELLSELPGVQVNNIGPGGNSTTATPNQSIAIHGFTLETKLLIEGHPVSSGVFGSFFTQFLDAGLISSVQVTKGAGLTGATAGQSAIGTINVRTIDFTQNDSGFIRGGIDSFGTSYYSAVADVNFLKDNRLSVILGLSTKPYEGPTKGYYAPNFDYHSAPSGTYGGPYLPQNDAGLINTLFDDSNTDTLHSELAKVRYKFSDVTSIQGEFFGAQGKYNPQGGSYSSLEGNVTVAQCTNSGALPTASSPCSASSSYNAPWTQNLVGQTIPGYSLYPGSNVLSNNPNFSAEFRTAYKDDTFVFRPYAAVINRTIDGSQEVNVPGNGVEINSTYYDDFYQVTNPANCTVAFTKPNGNGAFGPCFAGNAALGSVPYVIDPKTPHSFAAQSTNVPSCSVATPCYTTGTYFDNAGVYGYGTPFNQPELDQLNGYTFTYVHPFGANTATLQFDHFQDDTQKLEGDTSSLAVGPYKGCQYVVGLGVNPQQGTLGYQPCVAPGTQLPETPLLIPETIISQSDLSLDLQYQLASNLQFDFGNFFTLYKSFAQIENPNLVASYALYGAANKNWTGSTSIAPVSLVSNDATYAHYDPHFGFVFRPNRDIAVRASAGSSISTPYASQISGLTKVQLAGQSATVPQNVITEPNTSLKPEETVAFDLGSDIRLGGGTILSGDLFDDTVHNKWVTFNNPIPTPAGIPDAPGGTVINQVTNASRQVAYGIEGSIANLPRLGFGYTANATIERSYYADLPLSLFQNTAAGTVYTTPFNGEQTSGTAYATGYASLQYRGERNSLVRVGMRYLGANNSNYVPAYVAFDGQVAFDVAKNTTLQLSADNFTNVSFNTLLARATYAAGTQPVAQSVGTNGVTSYNAGSVAQDIFAIPYKTVRFSLTHHF
jgi:outer membrane receptor protein involved in Fe transport